MTDEELKEALKYCEKFKSEEWFATRTERSLFEALLSEHERANKLQAALAWIMPKVHQGNHEGALSECGKATCRAYWDVLREVK